MSTYQFVLTSTCIEITNFSIRNKLPSVIPGMMKLGTGHIWQHMCDPDYFHNTIDCYHIDLYFHQVAVGAVMKKQKTLLSFICINIFSQNIFCLFKKIGISKKKS